MPYTLSDIFLGNYRITQLYGANAAYYRQFGLAGHEGVDWGCPVGVKVLCPFNSGIILRTGWDRAYGYYIVIWDKTQRCAVWHCHLSKIYVNAGQTVGRFTVVGLTGATGNVTGPHLHEDFVVTDAWGNRLNRSNGFQGYLNILDKNLVKWSISKMPRIAINEQETVTEDNKEGATKDEKRYYTISQELKMHQDVFEIKEPKKLEIASSGI